VSLYQNAYLVLGNYSSGQVSTWADALSPIEVDASSPGLKTNQWHHFAFTYDGSFQRVFIDGVMVAQQATTGSVTLNTSLYNSGLNIGARYTGNTQFVQGMIENVRIHDTALSAQALGFFRDGVSQMTQTAVPTMNEWGMIIFIVLAGLGSVYFLRRQKRV
jgi:concanavalin A-like lectin/glucanase superfamily protein